MSIPKIIHYCWLSGDVIPESYATLMQSWRKKLSGYEFVLHDAKSFDIKSLDWTSESFDAKMYACAADYIRLWAVYSYGGIYLDMDMEVVKPFDDLLDTDLLLAYENHISENIEAGCFGAVKFHPYIKKCMEYFEGRHFFQPREREKIMAMPFSERHEYINPQILPLIMKNVLRENFANENYKIYPRQYFTAKNVVTGIIEKNNSTYTIHHFATQYHSEEWRAERARHQKIKLIFGENKIAAKIIDKLYFVYKRIKKHGIKKAFNYYFDKYIRGNKCNMI